MKRASRPVKRSQSLCTPPQRIDRAQRLISLQWALVAADVGAQGIGEQAVGVVVGQAVQAPGPVVLETPSDHPHAVCKQGAVDEIARIAPVISPFETKGQLFRAIDPLAVLGGQAADHSVGSVSGR